jgi:hypothetical protein
MVAIKRQKQKKIIEYRIYISQITNVKGLKMADLACPKSIN